MSTSRRSPTSARSATNRSRPKFMLPPEMTATKRLPAPWRLFRIMWAFRPARERAPDGSGTDRVSTWGFSCKVFARDYKIENGDIPSKTSLMAAQISSLLTSTMPSKKFLQTRKGSSPTSLTAVPSANGPTSSRRTLFPALSERSMASPSTVSTPYIPTLGLATRFMYAAIPAARPPPPTEANMPSI